MYILLIASPWIVNMFLCFPVYWLLGLGAHGYFSDILGKVVSGPGSKFNVSFQMEILFIIPLYERCPDLAGTPVEVESSLLYTKAHFSS